jgi:hypothetical protein
MFGVDVSARALGLGLLSMRICYGPGYPCRYGALFCNWVVNTNIKMV